MSWPFSQAETPSATTTPMSPKKKGLIIAGIVLALILVIVLVVVLCVIFLETNAEDEELANQISGLMDREVNACDDFYSYACGGWIKSYPGKDSKSKESPATSMFIERDKRFLELLKRPAKIGEPSYKTLPKKFFAICNNKGRINERGRQPFIDFMATVGKFPLLNPDWTSNDYKLTNLLVQLASLGISTFFRIKVDHNNGISTVQIHGPWTGLIGVMGDAYRDWTKEMLTFLGVNVNQNIDAINEMFQLDKDLIETDRSYSPDASNILNVNDMSKVAPWLNWWQFFRDITEGSLENYVDIQQLKIEVINIKGFSKLTNLIENTTERTLANYVLKSMLRYVPSLGTEIFSLPLKGDGVIQAKQDFKSREEKCSFETQHLFPELINRMYSDEFFMNSSIPFIKEMISNLKIGYISSIDNSKMIDSLTKLTLKNKVEEVEGKIGNPMFLFDDTLLYKMYSEVPLNEYFESIISLARHRFRIGIKECLTNQSEIWMWKYHWSNNYYHLFETGSKYDQFRAGQYIFLPPELLQMPAFNSKWRSSMKYGALGSVIGHQMTHPFIEDNAWFSYQLNPESEYMKTKTCIIMHYHSIKYRNIQLTHAEDNHELKEITCDIQGIKVSLMAYRNFVTREGEEPKLPKLDLSPEQLFFVSFAQMMCEWVPAGKEEAYKLPFHVRVNGALQNFQEFSNVFGCSNGSQMNPVNKCLVL